MDQSINYDVVVVGTGNAACCAALAAVEGGARVGILEKAAKRDRGGNSALTGHIRFVFNGLEDLRPLVKSTTAVSSGRRLESLSPAPGERTWAASAASRVTPEIFSRTSSR